MIEVARHRCLRRNRFPSCILLPRRCSRDHRQYYFVHDTLVYETRNLRSPCQTSKAPLSIFAPMRYMSKVVERTGQRFHLLPLRRRENISIDHLQNTVTVKGGPVISTSSPREKTGRIRQSQADAAVRLPHLCRCLRWSLRTTQIGSSLLIVDKLYPVVLMKSSLSKKWTSRLQMLSRSILFPLDCLL